MSKTFGDILWFCPNAHAPSWSFPKYVRANSSERGGLSTQSIARKPSVLLRVLRERTSEDRESCLVWKRPSRQKVTLAFENAPAHRLFDTSLGLGDRQTDDIRLRLCLFRLVESSLKSEGFSDYQMRLP